MKLFLLVVGVLILVAGIAQWDAAEAITDYMLAGNLFVCAAVLAGAVGVMDALDRHRAPQASRRTGAPEEPHS